MVDKVGYDFNRVVNEIIKKSLFTKRQIEIILDMAGGGGVAGSISRGAYYRQRGQVRTKVEALFYSMVLVYGLGVLQKESLGVMEQMANQLSVISDSDITDMEGDEVLDVMERAVRMALSM